MAIHPQIAYNTGTQRGAAESLSDLSRRVSNLEASRTVINDGSIGGAQLADNSVGVGNLQAGSINTTHLQALIIDAQHIKANAINANHIAAGTINAGHVQAGSINAGHIQADAINAGHIQAGSIETQHLEADSITAQLIQADAIEATHIQAGAIDTVHLAAESVTASQLQVSVAMADQIVSVMSVTGSGVFTEGLSAISADLGTITAGIVTGATIRSAASGNRFEMGGGGMNFYGQTSTPGDTVMLAFDNATGDLTVYGEILAQNNSIIPVQTLSGEMGGINMLKNSSFEHPTDFQFWTNQAGTWDIQTLGTAAFDGAKVARATTLNALNAKDNTANKPAINPSRWYVFSYMAKSVNGGGTAAAQISWCDSSENVISTTAAVTITLTQSWQRVFVAAQAPSNAFFVRVGPRVTPTTASSFVYADACMFSEGERPMGFNLKTDEIQPGSIDSSNMIVGRIVAANNIIANSITTSELSATSIVALELTAGNARLGMLKANAVDAASVQAGAINAQHLSVTSWPLPQLNNGNWRNLIGYTNGTNTLPGWTVGANGANISVDTATTLGNSLKIVNGTAVTAYMTQAIALPKGRHIVSASVFPQSVSGGTGGLTATVASGTANLTIPAATADAVWTTQEMVIDVTSATATVNIRAQLGIGAASSGTLWVGPISIQSSVTGTTLTPLSVSTSHLNVTLGGGNLLADSSFEQSITGIVNSNAATTFTNPSSPKPGTGSKSFRWFSTAAASMTEVRTDDVRTSKVENGRTYTFSAWVSQASGGAAGRRCRVKALMRSAANATLGSQFIGGWLPLDAPSGGWVRPTVTFTTNNASVDHVLLYVSVEDTSGGAVISSSESFWTDAWQLEEGDVATAWTQFLDATKIDGGTITAGTLQTAATGGRLVVGFNPADSTLGMSVYNSDGTTKNIEILGSGSNAGRITMRNLRFVDTAGVAGVENIEWYKSDNTTLLASLSGYESGSNRKLSGFSFGSFASAKDPETTLGVSYVDSGSVTRTTYFQAITNIARAVAHGNTRRIITNVGTSDFAQTPSERVASPTISENNSSGIDSSSPASGTYVYFLTGTRASNGDQSTVMLLARFSSTNQLVKIAECPFPGFAASTFAISLGEGFVRVTTPVGVGNTTWVGTRMEAD